MSRVCVVGSVNVDLHASVERFTQPGETLRARAFSVAGGGKGANQALALARLGAEVRFVGMVGSDAYGEEQLAVFAAAGVDTSCMAVAQGRSTGLAIVEAEDRGQNRIIIVEGANGAVDPAYLDSVADRLADCSIFLLQLELPMETVERALRIAKGLGARTILDPAPAAPLPPGLPGLVDLVTPNETETEALTGIRPAEPSSAARAGETLLDMGFSAAIIKAGREGAYYIERGTFIHCPAFRVDTVDSTAAGDAFNAALAFSLSRGDDPKGSLRFACAAGALKTRGRGAREAMPDLAEVEALLARASRR